MSNNGDLSTTVPVLTCSNSIPLSSEHLVQELAAKDVDYELVGSFRVDIGDQDQIVNIWRHKKGWPHASKTQKLLRTDGDLKALLSDQSKLVRQRQVQMMMAFSFWGHPVPQVRDSNYEMRSYVLKVGVLVVTRCHS